MSTSPRVLLLHEFPPETTGTLDDFESAVRQRLPDIDLHRAANHRDAADRIPAADIVVEHGITDDLLERAGETAWIQTLSSGADFYDLDLIRQMGAVLTTVSGVHARPIAEHVLAAMLYFERDLRRIREQQRRREWQRFAPGELGGQTLGIVGVGSIGGRVAELGAAFGMNVLGQRRNPSKDHHAVDEMFGPDALHDLLGRSDYVVLACPLTEETRGLLGAPEFSSMRRDATLVNVARGEVVDQQALETALRTGYLGGAALDVAETEPLPSESPLWELSNVLITPHMAGGSPAFPQRCADLFAENYERFVAGDVERMQNLVR